MTKLLAALNLPQVGEINIVDAGKTIDAVQSEVNDGTFFTIELNERIYTLKADAKHEAKKWVTTLNALKVGGLAEGGGNVAGVAGNNGEFGKTDRGDKPLGDVDKTGRWGCGCCGGV